MTENSYKCTDPAMMAEGSTYYPLLSNGKEYLCPDCGGYGLIYGVHKCKFCDGLGVIALDDNRVKAHPMTDLIEIGGIGNYYGCLRVKEENDKYFWSIENWDGHHWEEIPKSLYVELLKFEAHGLAL